MEHVATRENDGEQVYKHTERPLWGLAVVAYETDDKRAFQFEDGKVRVFKKGYLSFLIPVDTPAAQATRTLARLGSNSSELARPSSSKSRALPVDAQVMLLESQYPLGFVGRVWQAKKRGCGAARRLNRHRNPAIAEIQSLLAEGTLRARVEAEEHAEVLTALVAALDATDLVTKKQMDPLRYFSAEQARRLVETLNLMLHGKQNATAVRFERWLTGLEGVCGKSPGWNLATAVLALAQPQTHACVRPATFLRQAECMAPRLSNERRISGLIYERWLEMVDSTAKMLEKSGLAPQDNLDVYDFMIETLSPKSIERALALYADRQ